jgi:hypothetical protein
VADQDGNSYSAGDLANLDPDSAGMVHRTDDSTWPTSGWLDLIYTYGLDTPPPDVVEAAVRRAEFWGQRTTSMVPDWATSYQADGTGMTFRLGSGMAHSTGDQTVDAILSGYCRRPGPGLA